MFRRTAGVIAGSLALVVGVSGCSLLEAGGGDAPLSGLAACALGHTWQMDVEDMAGKIKSQLDAEGIGGDITLDGTQQLDWDEKGHVVITSDLTMTAVVTVTTDYIITVTKKQTGTTTGAAYISGEVAIPRDWDESELSIATTAETGGAPIEDGSPWPMPSLSFDDSVGLELTCDGDRLTIHPRGERTTQVWTKTS
ncbi:hypothetical protein HDC94_002266 [Leifsonia sp. AK011]|uniref:hypothetical protein n=1 Tax=Leifsonia sp. AK011 TaxID=2723075 RepID=UPI0015CDBA06|nr:hypothetical protein [Leifsonia sp. AK011]NYF11110.1 hypothetical protein [Leifsonia sp. AK011]